MTWRGERANRDAYETPAGVAVFDTEGFRGIAEKRAVEKYFTSPGRILDLGCGTGRTSIILKNRGLQVDAIDYSEAMIQKAKEKYPGLSFAVMDASKLAYDDATFDYAFFSYNGLDSLYPEENRLKALREIRRALKPNGIFAFSSHNIFCIPLALGRIKRLVRTILAGKIYPYQWDFQPFGRLLHYYISPKRQIEQLKTCGFSFLEVMSSHGTSLYEITWRDQYPTYICRK